MNPKTTFFALAGFIWITLALLPFFLPQYAFVFCWILIALPWAALLAIPYSKSRYMRSTDTSLSDGEVLFFAAPFIAAPALSLAYVAWQSGLPEGVETIFPWTLGAAALLTAVGLKQSGIKGAFDASTTLSALLLFGLFSVYATAAGLLMDETVAKNSQEETYQTFMSDKQIDDGAPLLLTRYFELSIGRWLPEQITRKITATKPRYVVSFIDPRNRELTLEMPVDLDTYRAFERNTIGCIHIRKGFLGLSRLSANVCPSVAKADESSSKITSNALIQQLIDKRFAELDQYFLGLQQQYEQGTLSEEAFFQVLQDFRDTDLQHGPLYREWSELFPNSYASHLVRGIYLSRLGWKTRGTTWYADIPEEDRNRMANIAQQANEELITSLRFSSRPYMSYLYLLNIAQYGGTAEDRRQWVDMGNQIAPQNFYLRRRYMYTLMPRWGGSTEEMKAFLEESRKAGVPSNSLAKLEAILYEDEAETKGGADDKVGALAAWKQVVALYRGIQETPPSDALEAVALILQKQGRKDEAIPAMEELLAVNPKIAWAHRDLGVEYTHRGKYDVAWEHLQAGANLDDAWCQGVVGQTFYFGAPAMQLAADQNAGLVWIRKAAAQGDHSSIEFLRKHGQ